MISLITIFRFSFRQQILSLKKFDVADLGIFFGQGFYTSEKRLVIFTERAYGIWAINTLDRYLQLSLTVNSIKYIN